MSLFNNIKKSLGFNVSEEDTKSVNDNSTSVPRVKKHSSKTITQESVNISFDESSKEEHIKKMQLAIFDSVVKIFNSTLPDFLKSSINEEAQKEYIFNSLDESVRAFITNIGDDARRASEEQWNKEKSSLIQEIKETKTKNNELESFNEELKKQQLSAERQKRALSTRLHDLEAQVVSFEAEKEQYELENRSLINKLKASSVVDGDIDALKNENIRLHKELSEIKLNHQKGYGNDNINDLTSQITKITEENESLKHIIEQLKVKEELSDAMINELNEKASNALRQLRDSEDKMPQNEDLLNKVSFLEDQLKKTNENLDEKIKELENAHKELEIIDEIQAEIAKFESIKTKKDEEISKLQQEVSFHKTRVKELENDTESLKSTIEKNLYNQAISEDILKKEITQLKEAQRNQLNKKTRKKHEVAPVKISAIDESIVDADWLISIPPEGTITRPTSTSNAEDFGYQAPPKKTAPENDAQMSLF